MGIWLEAVRSDRERLFLCNQVCLFHDPSDQANEEAGEGDFSKIELKPIPRGKPGQPDFGELEQIALDPISNHPQAHMFESLCAFRRQDVAASIVLEQAKKSPTTQCPPSRVQSDQSPGQGGPIRPNPGNSHVRQESRFLMQGDAWSRQIQVEPGLIGVDQSMGGFRGRFGCDFDALLGTDHRNRQDPSQEDGGQR